MKTKTLPFDKIKKYKQVQTFLGESQSEQTRQIYNVGLAHFETFLSQSGYHYTLESIIEPLANNKIDVYDMLREFKQHISSSRKRKLQPRSISIYLRGIISYLEFYRIQINPKVLKTQVKLPKIRHEPEKALRAEDVHNILSHTTNPRLKAYLFMLASGGFRASEAITLRIQDVNFDVNPTEVHVRATMSKTGEGRYVFISDEAMNCLQEWIEYKYRERIKYHDGIKEYDAPVKSPNDLIFSVLESHPSSEGIYLKLEKEFNLVLKTLGMERRKEGMQRREITFHSLRRFVFTTISNLGFSGYANWILGHALNSTTGYFQMEETERSKFYRDKVMPSLTFLDYTRIAIADKDIQGRLEQKDKEIAELRSMIPTKEELNLIKDLNRRVAKLQENGL